MATMLGKGNHLNPDLHGSGGTEGTSPALSRPRRIRTLVADNSATFENVIATLLRMEDRIEIVGRVTERQETIEAVNALQPDLLLINLGMPDIGVTTVAILSERYPALNIVLMSEHDSPRLRAQIHRFWHTGFSSARKSSVRSSLPSFQPSKVHLRTLA
ncbi:MAG: response regulator [Terriglobales bacterium]|jgi:CheY-like chemotaxis protein